MATRVAANAQCKKTGPPMILQESEIQPPENYILISPLKLMIPLVISWDSPFFSSPLSSLDHSPHWSFADNRDVMEGDPRQSHLPPNLIYRKKSTSVQWSNLCEGNFIWETQYMDNIDNIR